MTEPRDGRSSSFARQRSSDSMKARWADPAYRAAMLPIVREAAAKGLAASIRSPNKNRAGKPPHGPKGRAACKARMLRLWADPVEAALMRAAALKGSQRAQEARGGPIPKDATYKKVRALVGAKAARAAFKALTAARPLGSRAPASRTSPPLDAGASSSQEASHADD